MAFQCGGDLQMNILIIDMQHEVDLNKDPQRCVRTEKMLETVFGSKEEVRGGKMLSGQVS